jgi:hypothetical protein
MDNESPLHAASIGVLLAAACASRHEPVTTPPHTAEQTVATAAPSAPNPVTSTAAAEPRVRPQRADTGGSAALGARTEPVATPSEYSTPLLDARDLEKLARQTCEQSKANRRLVLVEFSAAWCKDCRVLETQKGAAPLKDELSSWELFPINVGDDGFQHPELMRAFQVNAIAKLVALRPRDCALPLRFWRPLAMRTLSGVGNDGARLNLELTQWLVDQRKAQRW